MISYDLKSYFVEEFHFEAQRGVVWVREAQVIEVDEVCQKEDMYENVPMVDAKDGEDGVEHTSEQKDTGVESLCFGVCMDTKIDRADFGPHSLCGQIIAISVKQNCEENGKAGKNQQEKQSDSAIESFEITAHTEH